MTTRTSIGTGDWSAAGTWDTGVPVDNDAFVIAAGHTVTFDVDQSGMGSGMAASSIAATGILICSTVAGDYYLKMNADLTLSGTLQAGTSASVPLPSDVTFTIDFNSTGNSIEIGTGKLYLYCLEPTNKYIKLTVGEPSGETALAVDTDVTADIWADGDIIHVDDVVAGTVDVQECTIAAGGIAAGVITILDTGAEPVDALDSAVAANANVTLVTRNIRITGSTSYAVRSLSTASGHHIAAQIDCARSLYLVVDSTIGGVMNCAAVTLSSLIGCTINCSVVGGTHALDACRSCTVTGLLSGSSVRATNNTRATVFTATSLIAGSTIVAVQVTSSNFNGSILGCATVFDTCSSINVTGTITNCTTVFSNCTDITGSFVTSGTTKDLSDSHNGSIYDTLLGGTTEFSGYNSTSRAANNYFESSNHDQVTNAYKAWCRGGIVTSQTASPPTGYDRWYEHACEDTDQVYPCFRQFQTVVQPGTSIEVEGKIRIADGEDMTGHAPALQIIDKFADPLVDSTQSPLDEDEVPDPDGSETGWQDVSVIWANSGDSPRTVIVRMIAYHDGGGDDVNIDEVWSIADYKDQIDETLKRVKRIVAGVCYVGDFKKNDIVHFTWHTKDTPSTAGTIKVYKNDGTGEVTVPTGITDTRDFDGKTGVHHCTIDLSVNSFYAKDRNYSVVLAGAVIDGQAVNDVIATFSIEKRFTEGFYKYGG